MKNKLLLILILLIFPLCFCFFRFENVAFAENVNDNVLQSSDYRLSNDYLDFYAVSTDKFTYSNNGENGGSSKILANAFDRNYSTYFESQKNNDYTEGSEFLNYIDIEFSAQVILDRIIYASEPGTTRGYPVKLNIYTSTGDEFSLFKTFETSATSDIVIFEFDSPVKLSKLRFEFAKVPTNHRWTATAREIIFLQPETDDYEIYKNMFTNYSQTKLSDNFSTIEQINSFKQKLSSNINFVGENAKIERAKKVLNKEISFDETREFSTGFNSVNKIERYGDIASYCRNDLQMSSFGTNRQVLGISANAGETINIYVEADSDDPLPKIRFSQHYGFWNSWLSSEYQLELGKNTFVVPNFKTDNYTKETVLGGGIYLSNPYTKLEQSENVKIYIEGGKTYPVMSKYSTDINYMAQLSAYVNELETNSELVDITEIITDHTIITVNATRAYEIYTGNNPEFKPSQSIENWNSLMDKLLEFGGVPQNSDDTIFDERNLYVNVNLRIVQPWASAWAYAASEHIGMPVSAQGGMVYGSNVGWGVIHEIGHELDNKNCIISETTNNMYSKFNETAIEQTNTRGEFAKTLKTLSNDLTYDDVDYFVDTKLNYLVWWYIETWHSGYFANLQNCYRGKFAPLNDFIAANPELYAKKSELSKTELQVFYSSMSTGTDLSYYFDRWGYTISNSDNDPVFKVSKSSKTFNEFMQAAIDGKFIDNSKQYKLWYQNYMAYHNEPSTSTYNDEMVVETKSVTKTDEGYKIVIDFEAAENHLGYEIWEGDSKHGYHVVGFTYTNEFIDTSSYKSTYSPDYKIVAYDTNYNTTCSSHILVTDNDNSNSVTLVIAFIFAAIIIVLFLISMLFKKTKSITKN